VSYSIVEPKKPSADQASPSFSDVYRGRFSDSGRGFSATGFHYSAFSGRMDPLLMVDHYTMSKPTFGIHPHAGLSAVSLLFGDSKGAHNNRDSLGYKFDLEPGDLYWLASGRGAVHDEAPTPGSVIHGLQIFVNMPRALKGNAPDSLLVRSKDMPVLESDAYRVKVAMGKSNDAVGAVSPVSNATILDGTINGNKSFAHQLQKKQNSWVYAVKGKLDVLSGRGNVSLRSGESVALGGASSELVIRNTDPGSKAHFVLFSGDVINENFIQHGPFSMSSVPELEQTIMNYRMGKFGRIAE